MAYFLLGICRAIAIVAFFVFFGAFYRFVFVAAQGAEREAVELSNSGGQLHTPVPVSSSVGVQASGPDFAESEDGK